MSYPFTGVVIENRAGATDYDRGVVTFPEFSIPPTNTVVKTGPTRIVRAFLYVLSTAELLTAFIGAIAIFSKVRGDASFLMYPLTISVLVNNTFLGICGGLGVVVANRKSRVLMVILMASSLLVSIMSVIVLDVMVEICSHVSDVVHCGTIEGLGIEMRYLESEFGGLLANEALISTTTVLSIIGASILFCLSFMKSNSLIVNRERVSFNVNTNSDP
jgi:hypothetical protein